MPMLKVTLLQGPDLYPACCVMSGLKSVNIFHAWSLSSHFHRCASFFFLSENTVCGTF